MQDSLPTGLRGKLMALALTFTMLAALWLGCVQPLLGWYADHADELERRSALAQRMDAMLGSLPDLHRQLSGVRASPAAMLEGASDAIAGATLQGTVQAMAHTAGASISSIETLPAEPRGAYQRIALRVSLAAPWPVLIELLRGVEQGPPTMLIDDLQFRSGMAPTSAPAADVPVSASFTILAFRGVRTTSQ
jgi:hypothetical protein